MTSHDDEERDYLTQIDPEPRDDAPWQDDGPEPSSTDSTDFHIRAQSEDAEEGRGRLPVWLRESSKSFQWRWVPLPIRKFCRAADNWTKGPKPAQIQSIIPILPTIQEAPLWLVERFLPKRRYKVGALGLVYLAWLLTFSLVIRRSANSGQIEGYGKPESIWCGASLWSAGNGCGLDGNNCRPFTNSSFAFKCNANCKGLIISNPRAVGDTEVVYEPFVVGGPANHSTKDPIYRGDSFICQAALHAGIITNEAGGCGVLKLTGSHSSFPASSRYGISSTGFDSTFPKSYSFDSSVSSECGAVDMRWPLLAVTVIFTTVLSLFISSPAIFFPSVFTLLFFHVGMVSDRPNIGSYASLFSNIIGKFLPAALSSYVIYITSVRPQLSSLRAQIEKTVLWLGGAWVGALSNYTFEFIPIQRLTPHDLKAQAGAVLALVIIVVLIFAIALGQIWYLRLEGRLRRYLAIYGVMGASLVVCVAVPWLNLRIHHYVLALLFLPGTRTQTRASLVYQGLLVGLFVNGIARWGFDSVLQTSQELAGDGPRESLLPNVTAAAGAGNVTFGWGGLPEGFDGVSVLVNDVERHRWYEGEGTPGWTWEGLRGNARDGQGRKRREYFRFAFMDGSSSADYTRAGVWEVDGRWREMEEGSS